MRRLALALLALCGSAPLSAETPPGAAPFDAALQSRLDSAWRSRPSAYRPRTRHVLSEGVPKYTNRLFLESSPYLLQHAHNPVNWYPWGDEAFETARRLGRPVLLSVGYSTCHWCHVMEEESFEDEELARVLNEGYVAIKVDREERPDVDAVYMSAVQALTERGGWPMTVWLTAAREPFFGGTYFPPRDGDRGAGSGFLTLLRRMAQTHAEQGERVTEMARELVAAVREDLASQTSGAGLPDAKVLRAAADFYRDAYDAESGGLLGAPKFPSSLPVRFLLRYHRRTGDPRALAMASRTLEKMAAGGIHDPISGGFHRYTVDARWRVPHFEKMLYDNALLAVAYLEGYQASGCLDFASVARDILGYVARDMTSPEGAFYSATDADSLTPAGKREEGRFFTWTPDEIRAAVGPDRAPLVEAAYGVTPAGNLEGRSVLRAGPPLVEIARELGMTEAAARTSLEESRKLLLAARARRPPPLRDEKILAAWNGLMIGAFARAALTLGEPRYAAQATRAAEFVLTRMRERGRLLRSYNAGSARHDAYLEDYAFLISGLIDLYEATGTPRWISEAIALDQVLERYYEDPDAGGYFTTSADHEKLLTRAKPAQDGAEPSGNSVQALNLLRLHELTSDDRYRRRAERTLTAFSGRLAKAPDLLRELLLAADFQLDTPKQVVIVAPASREQAEPLLAKLRAAFLPNRVLVVATEGEDLKAQARLVPLLEGKRALAGKVTAYVCERRVCELPTSEPEAFASQLAKAEPLSRPATPEDRALAYLMREVPAWREKHACGSCHNNGDGARALLRARELDYEVPQHAVANSRQWLMTPLEWERAPGEPGTSDTKLAGIQFAATTLAAFDAGVIDDRGLLIEIAAKLASEQDRDGAWRIAEQSSLGSPVAYGPFVATWLGSRTLGAADRARFAGEVARAEAFFVANPAKNVMDAAATALALADAPPPAAQARRREALELLKAAQTSDGGWGPYPASAPEAFDTALALLALARTAVWNREPITRGRGYLIRTQLESGGWKETTRPPGYQSYAQHISTTAWATLALLETAAPYPRHWWTPAPKEGAPAWEVLPQEARRGEVILSKRHELGLLSNFAATPFSFRGQRYLSLEGFWQMMLYPEGKDDARATSPGLEWKYTRAQVAQMTSFEAKAAGTLAEENMKKMGISWVTFEGRRIEYRPAEPGEHYRLIAAATREKVEQNPDVKRVLLATRGLTLKPDHQQEKDAPAAWRYNEILTAIRGELEEAR